MRCSARCLRSRAASLHQPGRATNHVSTEYFIVNVRRTRGCVHTPVQHFLAGEGYLRTGHRKRMRGTKFTLISTGSCPKGVVGLTTAQSSNGTTLSVNPNFA